MRTRQVNPEFDNPGRLAFPRKIGVKVGVPKTYAYWNVAYTNTANMEYRL